MRPAPKIFAVAGFKLDIVVDRLPDCLYPVPALSDNGLLDAAGVLSDRPVTSALDAPPSSSHLEMVLLWFEHFGFCLSFG